MSALTDDGVGQINSKSSRILEGSVPLAVSASSSSRSTKLLPELFGPTKIVTPSAGITIGLLRSVNFNEMLSSNLISNQNEDYYAACTPFPRACLGQHRGQKFSGVAARRGALTMSSGDL